MQSLTQCAKLDAHSLARVGSLGLVYFSPNLRKCYMKTEIGIVEEGVWSLTKIDEKTGKVMDATLEKAASAMNNHDIGQIIGATVKSSVSRREAFCSFLGLVYASPRLDGFKGTADKTTGKVSSDFAAAVRDVESSVVKELVDKGDIKLPKGGNPEEVFQSFMSGLRADKNYSNVKVTCNRYFALCGANVVTQSGFIVPVPVMQAALASAVARAPVDHSVASKLKGVKETMDKITIDTDDAIDSLALARELVRTLEGFVNHYAELVTAARTGVAVQAEAVIAKAGATPVGQRIRVKTPNQKAMETPAKETAKELASA